MMTLSQEAEYDAQPTALSSIAALIERIDSGMAGPSP
jgi:hypothetical protein